MKWISVKDKLPNNNKIIVAIMNGRREQGADPIEDALIVILRDHCKNGWWSNMDLTERYYLPDEDEYADYYHIIKYWMPWDQFIFPDSMLVHNQPERSKRENSQKCEMRCSEHCGNTVREVL